LKRALPPVRRVVPSGPRSRLPPEGVAGQGGSAMRLWGAGVCFTAAKTGEQGNSPEAF
jgi:hypothetical protein